MIVTTSIKDFILLNYNQEELYSYYLRIPVGEVKEAIRYKQNLVNIHRGDDTNPSLRLSYDKGKLRMWDFGNSLYRGDIFDLVGIIINQNSNSQSGFVKICGEIIKNFNREEVTINIENIPSRAIITYDNKEFSKEDLSYWKQANVSKLHLINRGVAVANNFYVNDMLSGTYEYGNPIFIYTDIIHNGVEMLQVYRPHADKIDKFRTNHKLPMHGINELYKSKTLIITKSRKDKLTLEANVHKGVIVSKLHRLVTKLNLPPYVVYPFYNGFYSDSYQLNPNYCVTNLTSESILLSKDFINLIQKQHERILINYDYDLTGITNSYIYYKLYNFIPMFIGRDANEVLIKVSDKLLQLINNKFNQLGYNFDEDDFINYIREHEDNYIEKDWFELFTNQKEEAKLILHDKLSKYET